MKGLAPIYLTQMFNIYDSHFINSRHNLRRVTKTNFGKRRFSYREATDWNNLDEHINQRKSNFSVFL